MKAIKDKALNFLLQRTLELCDIAMKMQDCADTQEEVNEIVAMRNYVLREIEKRSVPSGIGA